MFLREGSAGLSELLALRMIFSTRWCEIQVQGFVQVAVSADGVERNVLVANGQEVGIPLQRRMNRTIDQIPEQRRLPDDVIQFGPFRLGRDTVPENRVLGEAGRAGPGNRTAN